MLTASRSANGALKVATSVRVECEICRAGPSVWGPVQLLLGMAGKFLVSSRRKRSQVMRSCSVWGLAPAHIGECNQVGHQQVGDHDRKRLGVGKVERGDQHAQGGEASGTS